MASVLCISSHALGNVCAEVRRTGVSKCGVGYVGSQGKFYRFQLYTADRPV